MQEIRIYFMQGCIFFVLSALPLLLICGLVVVICTVAQTRGLFTMKAAAPKFGRMNPLQGIKKMFSLRGVVELLKSIVKIIILGYIIYNSLGEQFFFMPRLMDMSLEQALAFTGNIILDIAKTAAIVMVFVAGFDYLYQWWDFEKNLRMSKQE